jgi:HAD superfamily hydrolase (TIGR01509 family)
MEPLRLVGCVVTGVGAGASFTQLSWARQQFIDKLGLDPYPGTLNLLIDTSTDHASWASLKARPGYPINPPDSQWCQARCYPVRIDDHLPGAIVLPDVPSYPPAQVEIIAALSLRAELALKDGDQLRLAVAGPLAVNAVILDVDGTLVDSVEAYHALAEQAGRSCGITIAPGIVRYALNVNHPTFWDLVIPADRPDQSELIAKLNETARRLLPEVLREHANIFPNLRETLEKLRARGLKLGIVTGSQGGSLQLLHEAGLTDFFEVIITGGDVEKPKPDPEGLLRCLSLLGVQPGEAVYVGDTPIDVRASQAAGMATIAVLSGAGDSALLAAEGPYRIIPDHSHLDKLLPPNNEA